MLTETRDGRRAGYPFISALLPLYAFHRLSVAVTSKFNTSYWGACRASIWAWEGG